MAKDCKIENMTVDAGVSGDVIEVENYDGTSKFMAADFRGIVPNNIYCNDCGEDLLVGGRSDINDVVKEHLED